MTIFLIFLTAVFTGLSWLAFRGQLEEMKGASLQTNQIIKANADLATAATQQAEAADKQATALGENATVARENMIASGRAWVGPRNAKIEGAIEVGKPVEITVEYANTGREPALNFIYTVDAFVGTAEEDVNGIVLAKLNAYFNGCRAVTNPRPGQAVFPSPRPARDAARTRRRAR